MYDKSVAEEHFDMYKNILNNEENSTTDQKQTVNVVNATTRSQHKQDIKGENTNINIDIPGSVNDLIALQKGDKTLSEAIKQAVSKGDKVPGYYFEDGVLYRLYCSCKLSSDNSWAMFNNS